MIDLQLNTAPRPAAPREGLNPVTRLVTALTLSVVNGQLVAVPAAAR